MAWRPVRPVATEDELTRSDQQLAPDDASLVDVCGIDMYPQQRPSATSFLDTHLEFHDFCASRNASYSIAEAGLGYDASLADKLEWFQQMTSVRHSAHAS